MPVPYESEAEQQQMETLFQLEKWRGDMREYFDEATDETLDAMLTTMLPALRQELASGRKLLVCYPAIMTGYARRGADWGVLVRYCDSVVVGEIKRRIFGE